MKHKILIGLFLIFCGGAYAQIYTPANPTIYGQQQLRSKSLLVQHIPTSTDTLLRTEDTSAQIRVINGQLMYHFGHWIAAGGNVNSGTGTGGGNGGGIGTRNYTPGFTRISGGIVTWSGNGLTFNVSPIVYSYNQTILTAPAKTVTLPAADPHFNTRDGIGFDSSANILVIPGTPGLYPVDPQPDFSQMLLTYVSVNAGDTIPSNISNNVIWDNDVFPDWSVSSTGITFDSKNTVSPYHSAVAIRTNAWINGSRITLSNNQAISLTNADVLEFYVKNTVVVPSTANIILTFYNNTTSISNTLAIPNYDRNNTTTYQRIAIPLSSYLFSGGSFNSIAVGFNGNVSSGVYLDYFRLQNGFNGAAFSGVTTFNTRTGNVVPLAGDYDVPSIKGLQDSLNKKQNIITFGDSTQYLRGDGSLGKFPNIERDSVSFTSKFRNLGNKGYPIIDMVPSGVTPGTYTNPVVTVDSFRITSITNGTASQGGIVTETDPLSVHVSDSSAMLSPYLRSAVASATYMTLNGGSSLTSRLVNDSTILRNLINAIPPPINPIAGTNITITGTFPNYTFNSTSSGGSNGSVGWSLNGNSGISTSNFLGTTDATPLRFKTNNISRMGIDTSGRVSFGSDTLVSSITPSSEGPYSAQLQGNLMLISPTAKNKYIVISPDGSHLIRSRLEGFYDINALYINTSVLATDLGFATGGNLTVSGNSTFNNYLTLFGTGTSRYISFWGGGSAIRSVLSHTVNGDFDFRVNDATTPNNGSSALTIGQTTGNVAVGTTPSADNSSLLNISSTSKGVLPPRMTQAQRNLINITVSSIAISNPGTGYTQLGPIISVSSPGYGGVQALATPVISGGSVQSITITNSGSYNTYNISATSAGGNGTGFVLGAVTSTQTLTTGVTIYCTDCTATDGTNGVMQTWNGSSWKNNW